MGRRRRLASPSRARFLVGPRWLSIGDAAVSHDPLCGHGIYLALRSGIEAAKILRRVPETQTPLMRHHTAKMLIAFRNSVRIAASYYRMERRWPQAAFWGRRRQSRGRLRARQHFLTEWVTNSVGKSPPDMKEPTVEVSADRVRLVTEGDTVRDTYEVESIWHRR
jgi:flavin-dependent dehydrogenase